MQSFCATTIKSYEVVLAMADAFWSEMWNEWFRPLFKDCLKTFSVLAVLYGFWEAISWMRFRGYPEDYLQKIESTHFALMYCTLMILGASFVLKLIGGLWQPRKDKR
jgi:hypothetical protein